MSMQYLHTKKLKKGVLEYKKYAQATGSEILYWMSLLIIIIATLVLSIVLIPLILILEPVPLYALILLLGITFGTVFAILVNDIKGLQMHHHVLALLFLPVLSLMNMLVVVTIATKIANILKLTVAADPIIVALVYTAALLVPYLVARK